MSAIWVEATDPKTQRKYYYNKETKKTQWTRPAEMDGDGGGPAAPAASDDPETIATNWAQNTDPKTGRVYYYNRVTKKTSWNKPACVAAAQGGDDAAPAQTPTAAAAAAAPASTPKPAGEWREAKDPNSGRTYWYNKATKETTWKNPFADGASSSSSSSTAAASPAAASAASAAAAAPIAASDVKGPRTAKELLGDEDDEDEDDDDEDGDGGVKSTASSSSSSSASSATSASYNSVAIKKKFADSDDEDNAVSSAASTTNHNNDDDAEESEANKPKNIQDLLRAENSDEEDEGKGDKQQADSMMKLKQARAKLDEEEDEAGDGSHEFKFAKHRHGWFARVFRTGNVFDESKLLSYKKSLIKKALLKQNRDLDEEAVQTFKNIMSYMGDRKSSKPPIEHAKKMIRNLMIAPAGLRDEAYMQLIKQTTSNPSLDSCVKGWELISFCLATFPPSKHLKTFLLDYLKKNSTDAGRPKVAALAQLCLDRLPTILSMGQRKQVPSSLELQCLMDGKPIPIRVHLCNGTFKTFTIDPYTTCRELEDMLVTKYSLTLREIFALYESAGPNEERMLDGRDRVVDVLAAWENKPLVEEVKLDPATQKKVKTYDKDKQPQQVKIEKKEVKFNSLLFKAKLVLKTGNKDLMSDPEAVSLIYIQATQDVVTQRYPCAEKDVCVLAALQLQATYGDFKKDVHVPGWLKAKINEVMPAALLEKKGKQSDQLVSEWEQKILAKYAKVAGFSAMEAKLNYLDYVQEWVFYGSSFFLIEQRQFKDYPSPLLMGINSEGVLLMHPEKKAVLENYHYTDIVTWGHSDEKFILVVGNIVQQRKLIFKTTDGKQMNHLIHDYVKFKVKGKAEGDAATS